MKLTNKLIMNTESTVDMTIIRSTAHEIHTHTFSKRGLSCWDDKRVWVSANESVPHGSVESPVVYVGPGRVLPPRCGDVFSDESDVDDDEPVATVSGVQPMVVERNVGPVVVDDDASVVEEERGEAVGFDDDEERGEAVGFDDDEERSADESENEEDRMFIDDDEVSEEEVLPLRRRVLFESDDDDEWDIGVLAKRMRCG